MFARSAACVRDVGAPRRARDWIEREFGEAIEARTLQALQLIASELISNAITHGTGEIALGVALQESQARIEVSDDAGDCDVLLRRWRDDSPSLRSSTHGRGLRLVDAYSNRCGCNSTRDHKTVWAEIDVAAR